MTNLREEWNQKKVLTRPISIEIVKAIKDLSRRYDEAKKTEELNEAVYSDKQRRYMCAMAEDDADRPEGLSQKEAKELCKGPMKKKENK